MVDYSKWKNIEISDDEEELDPSIDTPSLFKWRHQIRLAREADMKRQREQIERQKQINAAQQQALRERLASASGGGGGVGGGGGGGGGGGVTVGNNDSSQETQLRVELTRLERESCILERTENDLAEREKRMPWNVDTISKPGFEKTVINRQLTAACGQRTEDLTEAEREQGLRQFVDKYEPLCKQYGMLRRYEDSMRFLQLHPVMLCEHTSSYLVLWAITLEVEQQHELVGYVAHQCICLQYILELARQLDLDPRGCVTTFFIKIQRCVPEYREQFISEIESFKERIKRRAQLKIDETRAQMIELERKARLGPGGLDPFEVFDSLPDELKICFERQDVALLQKTMLSMKTDVALNHIKRCIDAGIWVPCNDSLRKEAANTTAAIVQAQNVAAIVTELMEATELKQAPKVAAVAAEMPKVANVIAALMETATVVAESPEEASAGEFELDDQESEAGEADEQSSVATGTDLEQTSINSKTQHFANNLSNERIDTLSNIKINQICYSRSENDIKQLKNMAKTNKVQRKVASEKNEEEEEDQPTADMFETELEPSKSFEETKAGEELISPGFDQEPTTESNEENCEAKLKVIEEHEKYSEKSEERTSDELQEHHGNIEKTNEMETEEEKEKHSENNVNEEQTTKVEVIEVERHNTEMENTEESGEQCEAREATSKEVIVAQASSVEDIEVFDTLYVVQRSVAQRNENNIMNTENMRHEPADEETQMKLAKILEIIDQLDESGGSDTNIDDDRTTLTRTNDEDEVVTLVKTQEHNLLAATQARVKNNTIDTGVCAEPNPSASDQGRNRNEELPTHDMPVNAVQACNTLASGTPTSTPTTVAGYRGVSIKDLD